MKVAIDQIETLHYIKLCCVIQVLKRLKKIVPNVMTENDFERSFSLKRYFINNVDSYHGQYILKVPMSYNITTDN